MSYSEARAKNRLNLLAQLRLARAVINVGAMISFGIMFLVQARLLSLTVSTDPAAVAIVLGPECDSGYIWLARNFAQVITVNPDLMALARAGQTESLPNITTCARNLALINLDRTKTLTFKELIFEYIYQNPSLAKTKIGLIKYNLSEYGLEGEAGELMGLLKELLYFAYYNQVPVYLMGGELAQKWADWNYYSSFFDVKNGNDQTEYLLTPHRLDQHAELMVKRPIPAFIIGYNQPTYIKKMVAQLEKYTSDIIIIDNCSTFPPLLDYYAHEYHYTLLRQPKNYGHRVHQYPFVRQLGGDLFLLTDPDLKFNPNLPADFIERLIALSDYFKVHKVGFALDISSANLRTDLKLYNKPFREWEKQFWRRRRVFPPDHYLPIYQAGVDTTFALVNHKFAQSDPTKYLRVAGNYTCQHLPWYQGFEKSLLPGELAAYKAGNRSTNYVK